MDYITAMNQIRSGHIKPVYLLYGEESYLIHRFEETVIKAVVDPADQDFNVAVFDADPNAGELKTLVETVPFFGGKKVIIIRGTALFKPSRKDAAADEDRDVEMEDLYKIFGDLPDYIHLVLIAGDKVDKRRKLYKLIEKLGGAVEVGAVKARDLRFWVNDKLAELGTRIAPDAYEHLLGVASLMPRISLGFISSELEKMALYAEKGVITRSVVVEMLSSVPEISVFAMVEAVSQKQAGKALAHLQDQLAAGEHPLGLIALLARQVRLLWQAKQGLRAGWDAQALAHKTGMPLFAAEKVLRQSKGFSEQILKKTVLLLADADRDLKSGRTTGAALERIIIEMCR